MISLYLLIPFLLGTENIEVFGEKIFPDQMEVRSVSEPVERQLQQSTNINFSSGGNRSRFFQIRGVGERSQFDGFNQSAVGVFYNHIDLTEELYAFEPFFVGRLKIHKNSQSFSYGSKGAGGAMVSETCSFDQSSCGTNRFSLGFDSFYTQFFSGDWSVKISPQFQVKASVKRLYSKGYMLNTFLNRKTSGRDESYAELSTRYEQSFWKIRSHHLFSQQKNGYDFFSSQSGTETLSDRPGRENSFVQGHAIQAGYYGDLFSMESITSLTQSDFKPSYDEDWGHNSFWQGVPGWNQDYDYSSSNQFKNQKLHQKFIFTTDFFELGTHLQKMQESIDNRSFRSGLLRRRTQANSQLLAGAFFVKNKIIENSVWRLEVRSRFEEQQRQIGEAGQSFPKTKEHLWSTDIELAKHWNSKISSRLLFSKAYRGGGFNLNQSLNNERRAFANEDLYSVEWQLQRKTKTSSLQVEAFLMERRQMQVKTSFQDDPMDPTSFDFYTDNAANGQNFGFEIQWFQKWKSFTTTFNVGHLKSRYGSYETEGRSLKGRGLPYAPSLSFLGRLAYPISRKWTVSASVYGKSDFYFSNSHDFKSRPYELVDLHLNYEQLNWKFNLWVHNLFDRRYSHRGFYFSNEPPDWEERLYTQPAPPRVFGCDLIYFF